MDSIVELGEVPITPLIAQWQKIMPAGVGLQQPALFLLLEFDDETATCLHGFNEHTTIMRKMKRSMNTRVWATSTILTMVLRGAWPGGGAVLRSLATHSADHSKSSQRILKLAWSEKSGHQIKRYQQRAISTACRALLIMVALLRTERESKLTTALVGASRPFILSRISRRCKQHFCVAKSCCCPPDKSYG